MPIKASGYSRAQEVKIKTLNIHKDQHRQEKNSCFNKTINHKSFSASFCCSTSKLTLIYVFFASFNGKSTAKDVTLVHLKPFVQVTECN